MHYKFGLAKTPVCPLNLKVDVISGCFYTPLIIFNMQIRSFEKLLILQHQTLL